MKIGKPRKVETDVPRPVRIPRRAPEPVPAPTPKEPVKTPGGTLEVIPLNSPLLCPRCHRDLFWVEGPDAGMVLACRTHGGFLTLR